jgi:hypothetical protein
MIHAPDCCLGSELTGSVFVASLPMVRISAPTPVHALFCGFIDPSVYRAKEPWHHFKPLSAWCAFPPRDLGRDQ